jgi:hypothetical protein
MSLSDNPVFAEYDKGRKQSVWDFYRCCKCGNVFSREEEIFNLRHGEGIMCVCGSAKYSPSMPKRLEWLKLGVMKYTAKLVLARGLAPWLYKHAKFALPLVERLVRVN